MHDSHTPVNIRDLWETPPEVRRYVLDTWPIDVDLACSDMNKLVPVGLTEQMDSLSQPWHAYGRCGFLNPPYSDVTPWMRKAMREARMGFTTVMLVPAPNGESRYWLVEDAAAELRIIHGRLAFIAAQDFTTPGGRVVRKGEPVPGNGRGSCFVIFRPEHTGPCALSWVQSKSFSA